MTTVLPVLRSSSLLSPFFSDIFADFSRGLEQVPGTGGVNFGSGLQMDVAEYNNRYVVKADLPGIRTEEVDIVLHNGRLSISVKPQTEVQDSSEAEPRYILRERGRHMMSRAILLPAAISESDVEASLKDGVLTVTINKHEALMPKRIPLQ